MAFGEITRLEPPRVVAYTWDWRNQPLGTRTEVTFEVEPDGSGSLVRLRHDGFVEPEQVQSHSHGWTHYEQRLAAVAEGRDPGPDTMGAESAVDTLQAARPSGDAVLDALGDPTRRAIVELLAERPRNVREIADHCP